MQEFNVVETCQKIFKLYFMVLLGLTLTIYFWKEQTHLYKMDHGFEARQNQSHDVSQKFRGLADRSEKALRQKKVELVKSTASKKGSASSFLNCVNCGLPDPPEMCQNYTAKFHSVGKESVNKRVSLAKKHFELCYNRRTQKKKYQANCGRGNFRATAGKLHHQRPFRIPDENHPIHKIINEHAKNITLQNTWKIFSLKSHPPGANTAFDFSKEKFKTCAFVGTGERLLDYEFGSDIDSNEVVFRTNSPLKRYTNFIGARTDILFARRGRAKKMRGTENISVQKACVVMSGKDSKNDEDPKNCAGITQLWFEKEESQNFWNKVYKYYLEDPTFSLSVQGTHSPSGGAVLLLSLVSSGICRRVNVYGISSIGSGHYFEPLQHKPVSWLHLVGLEFYVLKMLENFGFVCIF